MAVTAGSDEYWYICLVDTIAAPVWMSAKYLNQRLLELVSATPRITRDGPVQPYEIKYANNEV